MENEKGLRLAQWLLLVSAALFIGAVGLVIAGVRAGRSAEPATPAVAFRPVASVAQIMNGIVIPASTVVYEAVSTTVTAAGIEEIAPKNDLEWEMVAANSAALIEAGNLMLMPGHAVDNEQWTAITREFMDAAGLALKAAQAKDKDAFLGAGSTLNETCDKCHERYQRE